MNISNLLPESRYGMVFNILGGTVLQKTQFHIAQEL